MTVEASELNQYEGKRVTLTYTDAAAEGGSVTLEGKAEKANAKGVLLKPKGKTNFELIESERVTAIELAPDTAKPLTARVLKEVELGTAKNHLLERHGLTLTEVNELTEEAALEFHQGIDHVAEDLGHVHGAKPSAEKAAEVEAAAAEAGTDTDA